MAARWGHGFDRTRCVQLETAPKGQRPRGGLSIRCNHCYSDGIMRKEGATQAALDCALAAEDKKRDLYYIACDPKPRDLTAPTEHGSFGSSPGFCASSAIHWSPE